jgi:hypothetical protein
MRALSIVKLLNPQRPRAAHPKMVKGLSWAIGHAILELEVLIQS